MKIKNLIFSLLVATSLTFSVGEVAFAKVVNRDTHINSHMDRHIGEIKTKESFVSWHSSYGYWRFNYRNDDDGGIKEVRVLDKDVPTYFPGNSKVAEDDIVAYYPLPSSVKEFINAYGESELGISIKIGAEDSIANNIVNYSIEGESIKISFRPIFWYTTNNWWYGTRAWDLMTTKGKVPVPRVKEGFGYNRLSVYNGGHMINLEQWIIDSAYKRSDGHMGFNTPYPITVIDSNLGTEVVTPASEVWAKKTVWGGGNHGITWDFPIDIKFYDLNISADMDVEGVEYIDTNTSTYWVQSDNEFTITTSGTPSAVDDVVRPTQNGVRIDNNGSQQWLLFKKSAKSSTVENITFTGENYVNFSEDKVRSNTSENATFTTSADVYLSGDKDIVIDSITYLNNFQNGIWDDSKLYKYSSFTNSVIVKSDSKAPKIVGQPSYEWTNENITINIQTSDERSGVKSTSLYKDGKEIATGTDSLNYTETKEGIHTFKVVSIDNVGNSIEDTFKVRIDKTAPIIEGIPSSDWTRNDVVMKISANDGLGSGVKSIKLFKDSKQVASGGLVLNYTERNEGIHTFKIVAEDNVGNIREEEFTVRIDKTAPIGDVTYDYDDNNGDLKIVVENVVETGSGLNSIWVEYFPKKNPSRIIKEDLVNIGDSFKVDKNLINLFPDTTDTVGVIVKAIDNVGNERILFESEFDTFLVSATIERVLAPHEPIFNSGEKGVLKIKLTNGVDKVKITFPKEFTKLDDTLNTEIILDPKKYEEIDYEFFVPLEVITGKYSVTVEGFKEEKKKVAQPTMQIKGKITDKLRTRIRLPE